MVADGKPYRNQKIVFVFLWFCSGNIRCKWNPYYRMSSLRNKDKHCLKFAFPGTTFFFFFVKMSIADCFTCLCSVHSFVGAGNYRGTDSKQSSVKCREGLEKKTSLFTLDQHYQSHMKSEQSEKKQKNLLGHTHTHGHTKRYHFSI